MESCFKRLKTSDERRREWIKKLEQEPVVPAPAPVVAKDAAVTKDASVPAEGGAATAGAPPPAAVSSS